MAAVNLHLGMQELGKRVIEPTIPTKALLELTEHFYKVSGLAAKQEPKQLGTGFSITINIPSPGGATTQTLSVETAPRAPEVIEGDAVVEAAEENASLLLANKPAFLQSVPGNLSELSSFID